MRNRAAAAAVVLALALSLPARAQSVVPTADPVITIQSAGAEPRRVLRYTTSPGAKERLDMTMRMSLAMSMGDMALPAMDVPAITISMDTDVTEVNAAGDIASRFTFADVAMEGAALPPGSEGLKGLGGSMTVTNRGLLKSMNFDTAAVTDPMVKQLLSSTGIEKLATPLPAEALGIGARWDVVQAIALNGMSTTQKTAFELVTLDATSATVKVVMTQSAEPQKALLPGLPPEADVQLLSLEGGGTGTLTLTPGFLALIGDMDVVSKVVMEVKAEGQTQRMSTSTTLKMTLAKGKR